ncbi:MAG: prolyl oligopeptidase family serine peptidase, partial [Mycobacterium sp.]
PTQQRTLIPHRDDVRLDAVDAFAGHLVISYRREALPRLQLWHISSEGNYSVPEEISFDSELMSTELAGNPNWDAPKLRIRTGSLVIPVRIYDVDFASGERTLLREQPVLGDYRPADYVERRDWVLADDGARIPVSIVYRAGIEFPAPTLLYGYGAYEMCTDPSFSIARLSLLDRGMVFAIAHVRGGGEMGRLWYEHGKLLEKKNTFTDFVAVARHLVDTGVTRPHQLVALGGSAGGLLMGAVANLAPDLFAGILAQVPFVDPLTTILDPSLPLTVTEWDEWGNPLQDRDVYSYMQSYSPYENVEAKRYPAILAMTSLNDTRVYYVEPAKWVAALRHVNADGSPILLKTQMNAGHGGVSGRYKAWKETAFQYAWLLAAADSDRYGGGQKDDLSGDPQG